MSVGNPFKSGNLPLTVLTLVATATAVYGYLQPDTSVAGMRFYLDNSGGAVVFTHAAHQEHASTCVACHHALIQGEAYACSECHDDPEYVHHVFAHADLLEIEDHACDGCHPLQPDIAARSCRACHPSAADEQTVTGEPGNCQQCHDDPDYTPEDFSHADLLEIEDHACDGCHRPVPVGEVYHENCTACHRDQAAERFINNQGQPLCKACHLI